MFKITHPTNYIRKDGKITMVSKSADVRCNHNWEGTVCMNDTDLRDVLSTRKYWEYCDDGTASRLKDSYFIVGYAAPQDVKSAAELLDNINPGWAGKIDTNKLNLNDNGNCVLGQLYGDFRKAKEELFNGQSLIVFSLNTYISYWRDEINNRLAYHDRLKIALSKVKELKDYDLESIPYTTNSDIIIRKKVLKIEVGKTYKTTFGDYNCFVSIAGDGYIFEHVNSGNLQKTDNTGKGINNFKVLTERN